MIFQSLGKEQCKKRVVTLSENNRNILYANREHHADSLGAVCSLSCHKLGSLDPFRNRKLVEINHCNLEGLRMVIEMPRTNRPGHLCILPSFLVSLLPSFFILSLSWGS